MQGSIIINFKIFKCGKKVRITYIHIPQLNPSWHKEYKLGESLPVVSIENLDPPGQVPKLNNNLASHNISP